MQSIDGLASEHSNKFCADCSVSNIETHELRPVTSVSVNNGVFLCADCARKHLSCLKPDISMIKPIDLDDWTYEQIGLVAAGGNMKFAQFISGYDVLAHIEANNLLKEGI